MSLIILPLFGYFLGSLPFAIWITRLTKGVDVRDAGSKHATTTNTIRQAGWLSGVLVMALDISKGFVPAYLASRLGLPSWGIALTAALAVAGHCWPVFAQFRGGMGLATAGGAFLAISPLGFAITFATLLAVVLAIRHGARGSLIAGLLAPPVMWLLGLRGDIIWVSALVGLVIAGRFTIDWKRQYRELWLDREQEAVGSGR